MIERSEADATLGDRIPYPFPSDPDTDLQQWLGELQAEADALDEDIDATVDSLQVVNATGLELDELGKDFGELGKRRGRPDDQYRAFLLGLVAAFDGRGTPPGVRLAIAVGILASVDDVSLIEDFETQEYEVVLENEAWAPHRSGTVRDLADLADPSVVQLRDPVHNRLVAADIGIASASTIINSGTELETAGIGIDAGDTEHETINSEDTFGTGRFDGESTFS